MKNLSTFSDDTVGKPIYIFVMMPPSIPIGPLVWNGFISFPAFIPPSFPHP